MNTNTFELRMYDPRFGRWLSPDPYGQYASPYLAMGNNPVSGIDPDGGFDPGPGPMGAVWDASFGAWVLPEVTVTASRLGTIAGSLAGLTASLRYLDRPEYLQNHQGDLFYVQNTNAGSQYYKLGADGWEMYRDEIKLAQIRQQNMYLLADKIGETTQDAAITLATGPAMELATAPVLNLAEGFIGRIFSGVASRSLIKFETQLANRGILGFTEHGAKQMAARGFSEESVLKIISEGTPKPVVYKGAPQIHYLLGKYKIAVKITGRNGGKIISILGDYNSIGANGVRGVFTGF